MLDQPPRRQRGRRVGAAASSREVRRANTRRCAGADQLSGDAAYIQEKLYISEGTAKTHIRHVYKKTVAAREAPRRACGSRRIASLPLADCSARPPRPTAFLLGRRSAGAFNISSCAVAQRSPSPRTSTDTSSPSSEGTRARTTADIRRRASKKRWRFCTALWQPGTFKGYAHASQKLSWLRLGARPKTPRHDRKSANTGRISAGYTSTRAAAHCAHVSNPLPQSRLRTDPPLRPGELPVGPSRSLPYRNNDDCVKDGARAEFMARWNVA